MTQTSRPTIDWQSYYNREHEVHRFLPELDPAERYRTALVESLLPREPLNSLLDAGCGDGFQCQRFSGRFQHVVGCDISLARAQFAQQHSPGAKFLSASLSSLPFRSHTFDVITLCEVLEHMEEPVTVLRELARVSRRYVLITVPYKQKPQIILCPHCSKPFPIDGHLHMFVDATFQTTLEQAGLRVVRIEKFYAQSPWESLVPIRWLSPRGKKVLRQFLIRLSVLIDNAQFIGALCEIS
jgi:ubiquinone/menaquinone biosynthesis C-methylase UbiE